MKSTTTETNLEKFIKIVGFYDIKNKRNGIINFDSLMNDLKNTTEYKQILSEHEVVERLKAEIEKRKNQTITLNDGNIDICNNWIDKLLKSILENEK